MGGSSSKEVVEVDEESQKEQILKELDQQLDGLRQEVGRIQPLITKGVKDTTHTIGDALIMRYSQLQDRSKMEEDIQKIFGKYPGLDFLKDTASTLIAAMNSTKEMTEIVRWQERKTTKRIGDKVVGLECHYKVKIIEKSVGRFTSSKETVCLIAYKYLVHILDKRPEEYLDDEETKRLTF